MEEASRDRASELDSFAVWGSPALRWLLGRLGGGIAAGLALLYALVTVATPGGMAARPEPAALTVVAAIATVLLMTKPARFPVAVLDAASVGASLTICLMAVGHEGVRASVPFALLGLNLLAFGLRRPRVTFLLAGGAVAGYAVLLGWGPGQPAPVARWLAFVLALGTSGLVIQWLVLKVRTILAAELEAQREARQASAELVVVDQAKSAFLSRMSHELRTPLNAVLGFAGVLRSGAAGPLDPRQESYVVDIADAGRHLLGLVDEVLDLNKVELGRVDLDVTAFDLWTVLDESLRMVRERAARGGIRLRLERSLRETVVEADERKVRQVFVNLLSNAVRFTPAGGRVTVYVDGDRHRLRVSVRDSGVGIGEDDLDRVFAEYEQAGASPDGTGLGLPLSRRFVEAHGGSLDVASKLGTGTVFTFDLPRRPPGSDQELREPVTPDATDTFDAITTAGSAANREAIARLARGYCVLVGCFGPILALLTPGSAIGRVVAVGLSLVAFALIPLQPFLDVRSWGRSGELFGGVGIVLISAVAVTPTALADVVPLLYVWVVASTFVLWSGRRGVQHVVAIGGAYAVVLVLRPDDPLAVVRWVSVMCGLTIVGGVAHWMASTLRRTVVAEREARIRSEAVQARLAEASHHKSAFLASMSHELRAPLNAIIGFADVLVELQGDGLSERQRDYAAEIGQAGRELLALINDILDLAKLEAGQLPLDTGPVSIPSVLQAATAPSPARPTVHIRVDAPDDLVVVGDGGRLHQAVARLVTTMVGLADADGEVVVSATAPGDELRLAIRTSVRDHAGPDPDRVRIADVLRGGSEAAADGAGVGFALAKGLVELQGGHVELLGGEPLTLEVRIPARRPAVAAP